MAIPLARISEASQGKRHGNGKQTPRYSANQGESLKTVQAILGHSDVETTLNTYVRAIPDSQRRALEKVAGVLFPDVPSFRDENLKVTVI